MPQCLPIGTKHLQYHNLPCPGILLTPVFLEIKLNSLHDAPGPLYIIWQRCLLLQAWMHLDAFMLSKKKKNAFQYFVSITLAELLSESNISWNFQSDDQSSASSYPIESSLQQLYKLPLYSRR